jgi:hypothetical protein
MIGVIKMVMTMPWVMENNTMTENHHHPRQEMVAHPMIFVNT